MAKKHDQWLGKRVAFEEVASRHQLRHALEIRHRSFVVPEFIELLRKHDVAIVYADTVEWPRIIDVTSDFVCCRLHGSQELYASGYDSDALDQWADWILAWVRGGQPSRDALLKPTNRTKKGRDVFVYFDNDAKVRAPFDAVELTKRVARQRKVLATAAAHAKKSRPRQFGPPSTPPH